jgi:hypothetical protein
MDINGDKAFASSRDIAINKKEDGIASVSASFTDFKM